jgi:hypothetical protein
MPASRHPRWPALAGSFLALLWLGGLAYIAANDPDPEPPGGKLKVLDQPEDKARDPDVVFVPTPQEVVDKMLELAKVKKNDVLFSLGCGDGRYMVTASKKYGCRSVGFDIDPDRVRDSKQNIARNRLEKLAHVRQRDIFKLDLSEATVVTMYLLPGLNVKLVPQLQKLKAGSRIVSHAFDMRGYKPDKIVTVRTRDKTQHTIYLWTTPLKKQ